LHSSFWLVQFWSSLKNTHSCMFFPNCTGNHTITIQIQYLYYWPLYKLSFHVLLVILNLFSAKSQVLSMSKQNRQSRSQHIFRTIMQCTIYNSI
jgi:hypothetical protein